MDTPAAGEGVCMPHPATVIEPITPSSLEGMRILFINMPLRETARPNVPPEGPLLLATRLRQQFGVDATIVDLNAYRIRDEEAQRRGLQWGRHLSWQEAYQLIERHITRFAQERRRRHGNPYAWH